MTDPNRGPSIRMLLELLPELTTTPPWLDVPWADFPLWMAQLGADGFTCTRRADGRVDVRLCEPMGEWGCVFVNAVVDAVRDVDLPPVAAGTSRESVRLPAVELERCELVDKAVV